MLSTHKDNEFSQTPFDGHRGMSTPLRDLINVYFDTADWESTTLDSCSTE